MRRAVVPVLPESLPTAAMCRTYAAFVPGSMKCPGRYKAPDPLPHSCTNSAIASQLGRLLLRRWRRLHRRLVVEGSKPLAVLVRPHR